MARDVVNRAGRLPGAELCLAALFFTLLVVILAYPVSLHPAALRVDMGIDGDLGWYILNWDAHAFLHRPWAIFDANIYYPDRFTLAYGENIIGLAFFAAPVIWLTGSPPLATTLVSLSSCALCGLGAYVLARRVGLSVAAAVICGVVFECAPPRFFRIGQITLTSIQWIPFALASAHAYFDYGRKRDLRWTAAFVTLQVLSSGHGAVFVTLCLLLLGVYRLVLGEPWLFGKRIRDLGLIGAALVATSALIYVPYKAVQNTGLTRGLGNWDTTYTAFLASPSDLHRYLYKLFGANQLLDADTTLFPGAVALLLAGAALVWRSRTVPFEGNVRSSWREPDRLAFALELVAVLAAAFGAMFVVWAAFWPHADVAWLERPKTLWIVGAFLTSSAGASGLIRARTGAGAGTLLRRPMLAVAAALLTTGLIGAVRPTIGAGDGLVGQYFANADWRGTPAFSALDTRFSMPWITRRWDGNRAEQYSVKWTGFLTVTRSGTYTFTLSSDDGSQLFIDGLPSPVVDNGGPHSVQTRSGTIGLDRGSHAVEVRYTQFGADASLGWSWSRAGGRPVVVPDWALSRGPTTPARVVAVRVLDWGQVAVALAAVLSAAWLVRVWTSGPAGAPIAAWASERRRDATTFYTLLTLLSFGLALGPPHGLWQYVYWMPGFNFIRASSRFSLVTLLGLSVMAGIGFDAVSKRWGSRRRNWVAAALSVVLLVEYASVPMGFAQVEYEIPAIDRWLDTRPKPFVIAEVPARGERDQVDYINHSTAHWQKTIQGYHGWRSGFHTQLYKDMRGFPDELSLGRLAELGVTYVVVHQDRYDLEEWAQVEQRLQRFASSLRLEHAAGQGRVYSITVPATSPGP